MAECVGCGHCCEMNTCSFSKSRRGPCPHLEWRERKYWCALYESAVKELRARMDADQHFGGGCQYPTLAAKRQHFADVAATWTKPPTLRERIAERAATENILTSGISGGIMVAKNTESKSVRVNYTGCQSCKDKMLATMKGTGVDIAKLLEKYTFGCSSINEHLRFLYDMAVRMNAQTIVELGVSWGQSTIPLAAAAKVTGGHLYSCDPDGYSDAVKHAIANVKSAGLDDAWTFTRASDLAWGDSFDKPIDLLFVDTSHERADTEAELALFMPKVRKGGVALFHDTVAFKDGVAAPILEFVAAHPGEYTFENRENNNGLGILTKLVASAPAVPGGEGVTLTIAYSICGDGSIGSSDQKASLEKRLEALLVVMDKANLGKKYPEIVVATGWPATLNARCAELVTRIQARARMITTPENQGSAVHSANTLGALRTIKMAIEVANAGGAK